MAAPGEVMESDEGEGGGMEDVLPPDGQERPIEAINILPVLKKNVPTWIEKEAKLAVQRAIEDNDSRADYMKSYANQLKLYAGVVQNLGYPAQGAKAPHIAIMTKALLHLWARIFDQVVPAKGDIVKCKPLGPKDEPRALRVERHMNWQLRYRMPDWGTSQQVSIMAWLIAGSTFRHYRWDPIAHTHAIDHVPVDDIIVAYTETDLHPQMKTVDRVTRVLRMARWEMERYAEEGYYSNLDAIFPKDGEEDGSTTDGDTLPAFSTEDPSPVREAADKIQGIEPPTKKDKNSKREIYAQNTHLKFPESLSKVEGLEALAGVTKPVTITVDKQTRKPVSLTIREEPDSVDLARYQQEMQAFEAATANVPMGAPVSVPKEPRPPRMNPVYTIIHYRCYPNPSGFYGLGVGSLLEHSNELANALAADYMLSGKFHNMFAGFLARGTKEKRGDLQLAHGKFIETDLEPEQLDKGIKVMDARPPSDSLMRVVEKLEQNSEIAASADILSGEKGASNETAKGMMVRNSNAMALISVMTRIYLDPLKYELKLVAHANSIYLDEFEYFPFTEDVQGKPGQQQVTQQKVGRLDYVEDVHLEFTADARMISKPERIADAKDFVQMILASPLVQNQMLVDFSFRKLFTVAEAPEYVAAMGPPPAPPPPPQPESQDVENAGFFNEKDHPALPDDNHVLHLHKIEELKKSPLFEKMSSTGKQMLDRHERAHVAAFYLQMQALQEESGVNVHGMAAGGGAGGMGPGPTGGEDAGPPEGEAFGGGPPPEDAGPIGQPG
jgi:hypothetical protein